jgi:hypothetical protein
MPAGAAGPWLTLVTGATHSVTRTCAMTLASCGPLECEKNVRAEGRDPARSRLPVQISAASVVTSREPPMGPASTSL